MAHMAASLIASVASLLIQPITSWLINSITAKGQEGGFLPFSALPLKWKYWGKELEEQEQDIWIITFSSTSSFKQYRDYWLFQLWA